MTFSLYQKPNRKNLIILFVAAFLIRAATFHFYVQHCERYKQPDTPDYHNCAIGVACGTGMHRPDTMQPIFWRTPGYPLYLSWFYNWFGLKTSKFSENKAAQTAAIWTQIGLSSLLPLLIFFLVLFLTGVLPIAWLTAWIFVFHIGMVLASTYLLTEALSLLFFMPFLLFFYKSFRTYAEPTQKNRWVLYTILAAGSLGIATWIRPMGEFISIVAAIIILLLARKNSPSVDGPVRRSLGVDGLKHKLKQIGLFFLVFFIVTSGWYIRNYNITGKLFFCPMFGPYLNSFCAPKILRDTTHMTLKQSISRLYKQARAESAREAIRAHARGKKECKELCALKIAIPILKKHPWIFIRDWIKEVLKTTFDLHSHIFVGFVKNCFWYDPLEEFLTEKWVDCVYKQPMPLTMRLLIFLEIIFSILKWIGLLIGAWMFLCIPILRRFKISEKNKQLFSLWLKVSPVIGAILFMTGGFGYARLRLPVDPLMVMLSLTCWFYLLRKGKRYEKDVRAMED